MLETLSGSDWHEAPIQASASFFSKAYEIIQHVMLVACILPSSTLPLTPDPQPPPLTLFTISKCLPSFCNPPTVEPKTNETPQILDRNLNPFSIDDFDFVMNVNVRGTIDLIRQVLPHIARSAPQGADGERGVIIMVASSAAYDGQPGQGIAPLSLFPLSLLPLCPLPPHPPPTHPNPTFPST
jgi:NAD(P)-dependent dehydrogenase (short-subunit alcohol dehydrogenase family)